MKLLTKAIEASIPKLYSTENIELEQKVAIVKFFDPTGRGTWYIVEGSAEGDDFTMFGFCRSPLGADCDEWGYVSLNELQAVRGRFGLGIERDLHWKPTPMAQVLAGNVQ